MRDLKIINTNHLPDGYVVAKCGSIRNSPFGHHGRVYSILNILGFKKYKNICAVSDPTSCGDNVFSGKATIYTNGDYEILVVNNYTIIIHENYIYDFMTQYRKLRKKYRDTVTCSQPTPLSIIDQIYYYANNTQLVNQNTIDAFIEHIKPYVTTFHERKCFEINVNLSLIFSGKPGDGKSYFAFAMGKYIASLLSLTYVEETAITFQKVVYAKDDFISVLDDMNPAHFRRESGDICQRILTETDKNNCNRLFLMTTNESMDQEAIDPAFFRPGRVQGILEFIDPDNNTKVKWLNRLVEKLNANNKVLDSNTIRGIEFAVMDKELTLANLMRYQNLLLCDLILYQKIKNPLDYVQDCLAVQPANVLTGTLV